MITKLLEVTLGSPYFYLTDCDISELCNFQWKLKQSSDQKVVANMIRGQKCTTANDLFDEFSAAFQFPYYFGENWDAFEECMNDLEWLPADAYVLCISHAENLIQMANNDFRAFSETLLSIVNEWGNGKDWGAIKSPPTPFNVVLHCSKNEERGMISMFNEMGIDLNKYNFSAFEVSEY